MKKTHRLILPLAAVAMFASASVSNAAVLFTITSNEGFSAIVTLATPTSSDATTKTYTAYNGDEGLAIAMINPLPQHPEGNSQYGEQRLALGSSAPQKPSPSSLIYDLRFMILESGIGKALKRRSTPLDPHTSRF